MNSVYLWHRVVGYGRKLTVEFCYRLEASDYYLSYLSLAEDCSVLPKVEREFCHWLGARDRTLHYDLFCLPRGILQQQKSPFDSRQNATTFGQR